MNSILRKQYIALIALVAIIIFLGQTLFYIHKRISGELALFVVDAKKIATFAQHELLFSKEKEQFQAVDSKVQRIQKYLVTADTVPQFIDSVKVIAVKNSLAGVTVVQTNSDTGNLIIQIEADSILNTLAHFLEEIQVQEYQVQLTHVQFSRKNPVKFPFLWHLSATVQINSFQ